MELKILPETTLIGKKVLMSLVENMTANLWRSFMLNRHLISNVSCSELYSVEVYTGLAYFSEFNPSTRFEKWAAVKVDVIESIPDGMEALIMPKSTYAVFAYKGPASKISDFHQKNFSEWIDASDYELDDRPHFAIMDHRYKGEDPHSEEDIWIPVRRK